MCPRHKSAQGGPVKLCDGVDCGGEAVSEYTWPGRKPVRACAGHLERLMKMAGRFGQDLTKVFNPPQANPPKPKRKSK